VDFVEKYRMPAIKADAEARIVLLNYSWPGNVRQLKNITEQISIIEKGREISASILKTYLPDYDGVKLPAVIKKEEDKTFASEREILYKILFDMKSDMNDLKKLVYDLIQHGDTSITLGQPHTAVIENLFRDEVPSRTGPAVPEAPRVEFQPHQVRDDIQDTEEIVEESLSLADKEVEMIRKALEKFNGKRKLAARELGISERTLYRKIKEYGIDL
ncbi:MAG TPA: helix-turn-helix domain-containing protein, partial [Bacteroidales bacterium]|nr:helix-turn-helix domain-containing protein [Bacteroidales bacterium]